MHECVELLSRYLRIDSSNPPGNERETARFFADIFDREGIEYTFYEPVRDRISVRACVKGSGKKEPLILLNHMDVVPVTGQDFSFDPFGGEIRDGFVCGRGALDMKGIGIMQLMAFLAMKRGGVNLNRDLLFLAVADEEEGGKHGARFLLESHAQEFRAGVVLNEGSFGISNMLPGRKVMMISTAEKGACWLRLSRKGMPGHGSCPHGQNALVKMNEALARLLATPLPVTITHVVAVYFKNLSQEWQFLAPYAEDGKFETLARVLTESGMLGVPQLNAMVRNTISLNMVDAGIKINVIPDQATACLDIRLLPGQDVQEFIDFVKKSLADDEILIEPVMTTPGSESAVDNEDYAILQASLRDHFPDSLMTRSILMGISDSRFFRERGVPAYGFCPIFITMDHLKMIHGNDEKISVEELTTGCNVYTDVVQRLCT